MGDHEFVRAELGDAGREARRITWMRVELLWASYALAIDGDAIVEVRPMDNFAQWLLARRRADDTLSMVRGRRPVVSGPYDECPVDV